MATQIINTAISYSYTLLYPCGENELSMVINNLFTNNEPFVGLSISDNGFTFIRDDADEVRTLIASGYDYWLVFNTWKFHLDFNNYEDDGIILKVPCINTSIKDVLQNTTLESLGAFKNTTIPINKIVASRYKLAYDANFWLDFPLNLYADSNQFTYNGVVEGKSYATDNYLCKFDLPIKTASSNYPDGIKIKLDLKFTFIHYLWAYGYSELRLKFKNRVVETKLSDGSTTEIFVENIYSSVAYNVNDVIEFTDVLTFQNGTAYPNHIGSDDISSAIQVISWEFDFPQFNPGDSASRFYNISGTIGVSGAFQTIETNLPAISLFNIESQILSTLGYSISTGISDIYICSTSANQLLSTKILDIYLTLALITGNILVAYGNILYFDTLYSIINSGAISFSHKCKFIKKAKSLNYAYIIGGNENVDLILDNAPSYFWKQTYKSAQTSTLFKVENVTPRLIINGAYIADKIGTNDNATFLIDNRNDNLSDGSAIPINYNFSASEICNNRIIALISETLQATSFSPSNTGDVVFTNPDSGITSEQTINESAGIRLAPYTEEYEVPMTSALITQIMGLGLFYKAEINGDEYLVESCTIKMQPQQCALILRKIIAT